MFPLDLERLSSLLVVTKKKTCPLILIETCIDVALSTLRGSSLLEAGKVFITLVLMLETKRGGVKLSKKYNRLSYGRRILSHLRKVSI